MEAKCITKAVNISISGDRLKQLQGAFKQSLKAVAKKKAENDAFKHVLVHVLVNENEASFIHEASFTIVSTNCHRMFHCKFHIYTVEKVEQSDFKLLIACSDIRKIIKLSTRYGYDIEVNKNGLTLQRANEKIYNATPLIEALNIDLTYPDYTKVTKEQKSDLRSVNLGMKKEILPAFNLIKEHSKECKITFRKNRNTLLIESYSDNEGQEVKKTEMIMPYPCDFDMQIAFHIQYLIDAISVDYQDVIMKVGEDSNCPFYIIEDTKLVELNTIIMPLMDVKL